MGQAAVDLPEPLDAPAPTTLAGTDDLLAQIAGDEIDRLIAESEDDRAPTPASAAPQSAAAAERALPCADEIPDVTTGAAPTPPAAAPVPDTAGATTSPAGPPLMPVDGAVEDVTSVGDDGADETESAAPMLSPAALEADAELDKLLDEMSRAEREAHARAAAPPAAAEPAPASTAGAAAPVGAADALPVTPGVDQLMSPEERDALSLAAIGAETDAAEAQDAAAAAAAGDTGRQPLPVVVLAAINAPLSFVPDRLRDVLGKVAILTLVNSLAVLIYVLFIRR